MHDFIDNEILIIELLLVVTLVAIVVRRLRVPYTVALVVVGLILPVISPLRVELVPELILALFVPPLVFDAAFHINLRDLQRQLGLIVLLAVPGVIITTVIVGVMVAPIAGLSLPVAFVFGALISATDPVAVVALFRSLGVSRRLAVLVEGESLLNDGTAIVVYTLAIAVVLGAQFNPLQAGVDFVRIAVGGTLVGLAAGWLFSQLLARLDDYLIETTLTTILAFGSYLLAEQLHVSGVLAVVAAGLVNGNMGPKGMSPTTRIVLANFWEYVAFLANSLVFLLIGLQIDIPGLINEWQPVVGAILAVLIGRALVVYGLGWLANRTTAPIPWPWRHVLNWGGLRGAISLALVLTLPVALGTERNLLRLMTYGVVLFTILVQGTTMGSLVRRLGLVRRSAAQAEFEARHARLRATQAALRHMENQFRQGLLPGHVWGIVKAELDERVAALADAVREVMAAEPALEAEELDTARREVMRVQRSALLGLLRDGVLSQDVYEQLTSEVDAVLVGEEHTPASPPPVVGVDHAYREPEAEREAEPESENSAA